MTSGGALATPLFTNPIFSRSNGVGFENFTMVINDLKGLRGNTHVYDQNFSPEPEIPC